LNQFYDPKLRKDYGKRISVMTYVIALDPGQCSHYYNRGVLLAYLEQYDLAFDDCTKALEINSGHVDARANRAVIYAFKDDLDKAIEESQLCLVSDPQNFASFNLISFMLKKGR